MWTTLAAAPAAADDRHKLLVLDLKASGVDASVVDTMTDLVAVAFSKQKSFDVVTTADVRDMMSVEAQKQLTGCTDDSCLSEIAGSLGAELVVSGRTSKLGTLTMLNLTLFDARKARSIARETVEVPAVEELPARIRPAVDRLADAYLSQAPPTAPAPVATTVDDGHAAAVIAGGKEGKDGKDGKDKKDKKDKAAEKAPPPVAVAMVPVGATKVTKEAKSGLAFVYIPKGRLTLGCVGDEKCDDDEEAKDIEGGAVAFGTTEVTVAAFAKCAAAGKCAATAQTYDDPSTKTCNWPNHRDDNPINCVTWEEAMTFCEWVGGSLPTAEQWEFAAKGGEPMRFPWGASSVTGKRANFCDAKCAAAMPADVRDGLQKKGLIDEDDGFAATAPVGSYALGVNRYGLQDMAGNVAEWTLSKYDRRTMEVRGGSWLDVRPRLRASRRARMKPDARMDFIGFRCVK